MMKQILGIAFLFFVVSAMSQNLNLDTNFGTNGIKSIETDGEYLGAIEVLDCDLNSFFIYSKVYSSEVTQENVIFKVNTDGTFDNSFGIDGKLTLPNYAGRFFVKLTKNKELIVFFTRVVSIEIGSLNNERVITKYDTQGVLDDSFGLNGEVRIDIDNSDGTGSSNIVLLDDDSILFSDSQKFIKYNSDGVIDISYGNNGIINSTSIGFMTQSSDNNLFFSDGFSKIEKMDYEGKLVTSFGNNGIYLFSEVTDYIFKSVDTRVFFMEISQSIPSIYVLDSGGNLKTSFDITTDNDSIDYFENFDFIDSKFYVSGISKNGKPTLVCYENNGVLVELNGNQSYKESSVEEGAFQKVLKKEDYLYACGYEYNEVNDSENFFIAKYDTTNSGIPSLSTDDFNDLPRISFVNNKLDIDSDSKYAKVSIYDLTGKLISHTKLGELNYNYSKGIYIIKVNFEDGRTFVGKTVIN